MEKQQQDQIINAALEQMEAFDVIAGVYDGNANALLSMAQGKDAVRTVTVTVEQGPTSAVVEVVASGPKVFAKWMPKETAWQCAKDLQKAAIALGFDPHVEMRTLSGPVEPPKDASDVKAMLKFRASLLETCATDSWTMLMALKRIEELEDGRVTGNVDGVREADRLSEGDDGPKVGGPSGEPKPGDDR